MNGAFYALNNGQGQVVTLDLTNGHTSFVTDFDPAAGIITGATAPPELASLALAVVGIVIIVIWPRVAIRYRR